MPWIVPATTLASVARGLSGLTGMVFYALVLMTICPIAFPSLREDRSGGDSGSDWDIATGTT